MFKFLLTYVNLTTLSSLESLTNLYNLDTLVNRARELNDCTVSIIKLKGINDTASIIKLP